MFKFTRDDLLADDKFQVSHKAVVAKTTTHQVFEVITQDLRRPVTIDPRVDPIQHAALNDAYASGVMACVRAFMTFCDEDNSKLKGDTSGYFEPLEPDADQD